MGFPRTVFLCRSVLCPPSVLKKELPGCAFQRLQHYKRKRQSQMKASLLIQTSSSILFPDPSAPPMMTYVLIIGSRLSPTSKVPRRDAEILKEAEEAEGKPTSWIGYVMEEKKTFDTSLCALPVLKPSRIQRGLCGCSLPLIRGRPLGIKQAQKWILFLYLCAWKSHKGDKAECQERRCQASTMHFFHDINRLPSTEQPDLVKAP